MKKLVFLFCLLPSLAFAQAWQVPLNTIPYGKGPGQANFGSVANTGSGTLCLLNTAPPTFGTCSGSLPALNSGRLFVGNVSNVAVAVALSGDCTLVAAGAITCTKTNGTNFGTAAVQNIGASGANVPLLSVANTWTLAQTFTAAPIFSDQSGSRSALGLGTMAIQAANNVAITGGAATFTGVLAVNETIPAISLKTTQAGTREWQWAGGFSTPTSISLVDVTAGAQRVLVDSGGFVGIGTPTPRGFLDVGSGLVTAIAHINGSSSGSAGGTALFLDNNATTNGAIGSYSAIIGGAFNNDTTIYNNSTSTNGLLRFYNSGDRVVITSSNVGIGTTAPTYNLDVASNQNNATSARVSNTSAGVSASAIVTADNGTNKGYFGVRGTGSATSGVLVANDGEFAADQGIAIAALGGPIKFASGGLTEQMRLATSGNVGIGTLSPSAQLHTTGSVTLSSGGGALKIGSTGINGVSGCITSDGSSPANITAGPCGTGLPGGGSVGQTVLNTASGTGNWFTQQFYNIAANASTDCTGVVATALSTVIGSNTNALIPPGCTIKVSADDTIGVTKTLFVQCGATVSVDTTKTLTINARFVDPGPCSLFTVAGTGKVQGIRDVRPEWFNCDTGTPNYEPCITRAIYSVENAASSVGDTFRISFQCSTYSYRATLTFTPTSAIPWRGKGCGDGTTLLESHSTFTGTSGIVVTNGADTTVHWIFEGIEFVNKTAGSGATVGITIGGTTAAQIMGGYSRSSFKNGHVSGYATNVFQQNARMINYDNFSSWPNDNSGGVVASPVGWKLTANLNGFVGDTDWINGSQCTSKNNNVTFQGSTSGTTLTVGAPLTGTVTIGMKLVTHITGAPTILSQLTGSAGSTGTYQMAQNTGTIAAGDTLGVYGTGNCVVMQDDGSNAIHISGIGFEAPFTCYYGATCWKVSITAPGTVFDDFWVSPRVQAESYGNGHALEVTASGSGTLWRNFNMNGIYFAGYGWEKNIYMLNNTSATAKDLQANNNYFAGTTFEAIDVRGTGGSNCLGITANGNILREPSLDGLASSAIYLENCGSSTVNSNTMEGTVGVVRANIVKFNSGGNYLTCVGNNSGGITTASGTSNVCVNSTGGAPFANGSNQ